MFPTSEDSIVIQKTRALCQSILDQPEFAQLRQRIDAFEADSSAQSQFQMVLEKGDSLQQKQQAGTPMSGEEVTAFEKDRQALLENPVAKGFLEAQEAMHQIQNSVNQYVAKTFQLGRMPATSDFKSEDCGPGCGCEH